MKILKQNTGTDVDSKSLKVSLQLLKADLSKKVKGSRTFNNTVKGFKELHQWIEKKREPNLAVHLTLEVTGVYHENLVHYFEDQSDYIIHVVLPNISHAYLKSLNLKSKTDKIDARGLGQMGLERELSIWKSISPQMRELKKTSRERLRLIREKTMVSNQLHAEVASFSPNRKAIKRFEARLKFIEKQILQIEKDLKKIVGKDKVLEKKLENVCTIKGVRFITAVGIVAEYNGFNLFTNRNQVVSFAGYDVIKNESGTSIKGKTKISKKGNSYTRQILYMPACSAATYDEHHKKYYQRIVSKTGIKMKGNVAIQRKLLLLIYALFTNNLPYDPNYHLKIKEQIENGKNVITKNVKRKEAMLETA
jgi:Transposase and inactivated derivatives